MANPIEFFFDFSSPYGYIASALIDDVGARHGRAVTWRPILLGAIFKITGMTPLLDYPVKSDYVRHDFARTARLHGIPFRLPDPFPFSGVSANRAFYWLDETDPVKARALAKALYRAAFVDNRRIDQAEEVAEVAGALGLDAAAVIAGLQSPPAKDRTRAENEAAVARGVFGSPYLLVDGEPFWGADRLGQVELWLNKGGW